MRVLLSCMPHATHLQPMVPLAWALRAAGHEVRVAAQPELVDTITSTGLTAVAVGTEKWFMDDPWDSDGLLQLLGAGGSEHVQHFDWAGEDPAAWTHRSLLALENIMISTLFASISNDAMIDDLVAVARSWRPDLVVWEPFTLGGAVAATVVGAAHARLVYGPDITLRARQRFVALRDEQEPEHREDPTAEWLGAVLARYGLAYDETVRTGQTTIDVTPPSTRLDLERATVDVRYLPYNGPATVPAWLATPPARRRVCLTWGVSDEMDRSSASLADIVAGLAELDAEIVVTLGGAPRAALGRVPDNVRPVDFVPLHELLPTCDAVVHHGGVGTRSTAEVHGVPQLIVAYGYDTLTKGRRTEELGAGLCLPAERAGSAAVRDAVGRLLDDPAFAAGARALRAENAALPAPRDAVGSLEALATTRARRRQ